MSTTKFASLHSGLLARKGQAAPAIASAMSPAAYTNNLPPEAPLLAEAWPQEALPPQPLPLQPLPPQPQLQELPARERLEHEFRTVFPHAEIQNKASSNSASCGCAASRTDNPPNIHTVPESAKSRKYQVRLRIDAEQRRRLRTAAAQFGISNQQILSNALSTYLDRLGQDSLKNCACLAQRSTREG